MNESPMPPLTATAVRVLVTDGTWFAWRDLDRSVLANAPRSVVGSSLVKLVRDMDDQIEQANTTGPDPSTWLT